MQLNIGCVSDHSHFLSGAVWDSGQAEEGREQLPLQPVHQPVSWARELWEEPGGATAPPFSTHPCFP